MPRRAGRARSRLALLAPVLALAACGSTAGGPASTAAAPPATHPAVKPIVLLVPGSGFHGSGEHGDKTLSIPTATWRRWGFQTRVAAYRPGAAGLRDVVAALQAVVGAQPTAPVCVYGESSGGTWALDAVARFPAVSCVVVAAAPTDEATWRRSHLRAARLFSRHIWPGYFGTGGADDAYEPVSVWRSAQPKVPVFAVYADGDPIVPADQGRAFARVVPATTLRVLRRGHRWFVHGRVAAADYRRLVAEVRRFAQAEVRR